MTGVGEIFAWNREGVFESDDAVTGARQDSGALRRLSVSLVNLSAALQAAATGAVNPDFTGPRQISLLLGNETEGDVAQVQKFLDQGQRFRAPHADAPEIVLSTSARRTPLAQIWNVPQTELLAESRRRGTGSVEHGLTLMRPFLIGWLRHTGRRGETAGATS